MERYDVTTKKEYDDAYIRQQVNIAKENPVKFIESQLGVNLAPHQKLIIEQEYKELLEG